MFGGPTFRTLGRAQQSLRGFHATTSLKGSFNPLASLGQVEMEEMTLKLPSGNVRGKKRKKDSSKEFV